MTSLSYKKYQRRLDFVEPSLSKETAILLIRVCNYRMINIFVVRINSCVNFLNLEIIRNGCVCILVRCKRNRPTVRNINDSKTVNKMPTLRKIKRAASRYTSQRFCSTFNFAQPHHISVESLLSTE